MAVLPSLRQLRYAVALADHGHFGRAAEACFVAQSSFSAGIQELEATLGVTLFERARRGVLVTPAGEPVLARARRLLRDAEDLVDEARGARGGLAGPLRLGTIPTVGPYLLPAALERLTAAHPDLRLYLREDRTAALLERLEAGLLDLLLLALPYDLGDLESAPVGDDDIVVICPAGHRFAAQERVAPADLAAEPLLLLEDGHCLRGHALTACQLRVPSERESFQATSLRTLVQMVAGGLGVSLLPRLAVATEVPPDGRVAVRDLVGERARRGIVLAWRRTAPRAAAFRDLAALLASAAAPAGR